MDKVQQIVGQDEGPYSCDIDTVPHKQKVTSFYEFWPAWLMYLPVGLMWIAWSVRYRSLTLPLLANPRIYLAGMVGGSKAELMEQARGKCEQAVLPWIKLIKTSGSIPQQVKLALDLLSAKDIKLPFVCKPDMGCRGAGVKLVRDVGSFTEILGHYPEGAGIILQKLASHSAEVGIFYVRKPHAKSGEVVSLTFKNRPEVVGDGVHTVAELVMQDPRAARLVELYASRNQSVWHSVLAQGQRHSLLFSASHCRGAVFLDGRKHITPQLSDAINLIMQDLPEFHYGRMDVKYQDLASLEAGETLEIVEINGASSEAIHIWDKDARLFDALKTLLWQYRTLFEIGHELTKLGETAPSLLSLIKAWRYEKELSARYPEND